MAKNSKIQLVIDGKDNTKKAFESVDKVLLGISKSAMKAGVAIAGAFAVTAAGYTAKLVKESIDAADAMTKMAQGAGVTTEALSGLSWGASQSGVDIEVLSAAMARLNKGAKDSESGVGPYATAFRNLGISVRDTDGALKSADDLLLEIADRFEKMPNGVDKSALAVELFGRSMGSKMIPFLNAGSSGISELTAQAERLGLVISSEQGAASEEFNDNLAILGTVSQGAGNKISYDLLPALNSLTGMMVEIADEGEAAKDVAEGLSVILKILATVAITVAAAFKATGSAIGAAAAAMVAVASGDFSGAAVILKSGVDDYLDTTQSAIERTKKLWDGSYEEENKARREAAKKSQATSGEAAAGYSKHADDLVTIRDQMLLAAKQSNKDLLAEEKSLNGKLKSLREERLQTEEYYKKALAKINGDSPSDAEPTYANASLLKVQARKALQAGDTKGAQDAAKAATEMILAMQDAGENTYGFAGFIKELEEISSAAYDSEEVTLQTQIDEAHSAITRIKHYAEELENLPVSVAVDDDSFEEVRAKLQGLAESAQKPLGAAPRGAGGSIEKDLKITPALDVQKTQKIFQDGLNSFTDRPKLAVQVDPDSLKALDVNAAGDAPPLEVETVLDEGSVAQLDGSIESVIERLKAMAVVPVSLDVSESGASSTGSKGLPGYASGGRIRGPGTGTSDSVIIRASNGEYMLRAAAVQKYGTNLLDNMNGLKLPKFADGGLIGQVANIEQQQKSIGTLNFNLPGGDSFSVDVAGTSSLDDLHRAALKYGRTRR